MKIAIMVEGGTEKVFFPFLRSFIQQRLPTSEMPKLVSISSDGRLPTGDKLKREVARLLGQGNPPSDFVIALTDVYTGNSNSPDFTDATDAKRKMAAWVGNEKRFFPHVAQYDFEAWLLPFWVDIQKLSGSNRQPPSPHPEKVNHLRPPSKLLQEVFKTGGGRSYIKRRDAAKVLEGKDLTIAAARCPELKAFLNRILGLCGGVPIG